MTLVKICGIRDLASGQAAVEAGADLLGFHFCDSRRRISPESAREIILALGRQIPSVGVFIDPAPEEVARIVALVGLDFVQLHGSEPPGFPAPCPVIKALKVDGDRLPDLSSWPDPILLDSWSSDQRGGTGRRWSWATARQGAIGRQVIVAGGLNPANVGEAVRSLRPYGVDVSSGVERQTAVKDADLARAFVQAVRDADVTVD